MINWDNFGHQENHFISTRKKDSTNMESKVNLPFVDPVAPSEFGLGGELGTVLGGEEKRVPVDHAKALATMACLHAASGLMVTPIDLMKNRLQYCTFFEKSERPNVPTFVKQNPFRGWANSVKYALLSPVVFSWFYECRKHDGPWQAGMLVGSC